MDTTSLILIIFIFIVDVVLIIKDIKNRVIFTGSRNKYKIAINIVVIVLLAITFLINNLKIENVIILIELLPLAIVGNKSGITENGYLINSYLTTWDKVINYSFKEQGNKYIVIFKTSIGSRKIFFKLEDKVEIKKYLLGIKKLRYNRK